MVEARGDAVDDGVRVPWAGRSAQPADAFGAFVEEEVHDGESGDEAELFPENLPVGASQAQFAHDVVRPFRMDDTPQIIRRSVFSGGG